MTGQKFCQSCSMPLNDPSLFGTEKDGSFNADYCRYCYHQGAFTKPGISLQEMISSMRQIMAGQELPAGILDEAIKRLPTLKRWKEDQPILQKTP